MTDKITKFLLKLNAKQRAAVLAAMEQVQIGNDVGLKLKKLRGHDDVYRVRIGRVRIIFHQAGDKRRILDTNFRDDNTYRIF